MPYLIPLSRLCLLLSTCTSLTSCGTASHLLGQAGGLINSVTSPVLGAIRLSDSPASPSPAYHDSSQPGTKRPH